MGDILIGVVLPLSLAFIMFSLGLGLTLDDFARVIRNPRGAIAGGLAQVVLLPLTAYLILQVMPLSGPNAGALALGVMILAFSPGGVTSNMITKFAGGSVALSVSLTAVISLLCVFTVPLLTDWASTEFMGNAAPVVNVTALGIAVFAMTTVPVAIGVALRHFKAALVGRIEKAVSTIATVLFMVIVAGALASNWTLFVDNLATLGPLLIILNVVLLVIGYLVATVLNLEVKERVAVAIETGVQNATLGIAVGGLIAETTVGFSAFALPSGVYGITMYLVVLPFVVWARSATKVVTQ